MEDTLPLLIYDEKFMLARISGNKEFHPQEISILFIREGEMEFAVNGEHKTHTAGHILFISPRNIYQLLHISTNIKLYILAVHSPFRNYISYNFNRFDVYKMIALEQNSTLSLPPADFNNLWNILDSIYYLLYQKENKRYQREILINSFSILVYHLVGHLEQVVQANQKGKPNSRKEAIAMQFMALATQHFIREKELKFYADQLHISVKYLSICVKDITGFPPSYALNKLLINEACARLGHVKRSIATLAEELEFADQFAFSKFFKKNMNQTPSEFRKKINQTHTI